MEKTNESYYLNKYKYLNQNEPNKKSDEALLKEEKMRQKELKKNKCKNNVNKKLKRQQIYQK